MTVKVRPYRKGGWEVDIMLRLDNGQRYRERRKAPVKSKSAAQRWGEKRERYLLMQDPEALRANKRKTSADPSTATDHQPKEVPTFAEFAPRYMEGYPKANRLTPSTIEGHEKRLRNHLLPSFGERKLDSLTAKDIHLFKAERAHLAPQTLNHCLSQIKIMLRTAVEWGVIEAEPVQFKLLKLPKTTREFYDFDEFEKLVTVAQASNHRWLLLTLLGGEAGLRSGEIRALEWSSLDFKRGLMTVEKSEYKGHVTRPKHGKIRVVPMTKRLARALRQHRHLQGPRVLYLEDGSELDRHELPKWLKALCKVADIRYRSPHCLRHSFCSHLAMRGAPVMSIKELAGHADLRTTMKYMHLTPSALESAIKLLEMPAPHGADHDDGDMMESR